MAYLTIHSSCSGQCENAKRAKINNWLVKLTQLKKTNEVD